MDSTDDDEEVQYCWYTNHKVDVCTFLDLFDDIYHEKAEESL